MFTLSALTSYEEELIGLRRSLHQLPEEGWSEFTTTARIAETLENLGFEVLLGPDIIDASACLGRKTSVVEAGLALARANHVDESLLDRMQGLTGCVGVLDTGRPGPTVALRFDIDCVPVTESTDSNHLPTREGFASTRPGLMHACGHDAHTATGLTLAHWVKDHASDLVGRYKFLFQPAEEGVRGAAAMAASGILDDVDTFLASHVAMMCKTGEVSVNPTGFLCTTKLDATFTGKPAHAGVEPNAGHNALAAACYAFTQLMGLPRHRDGMTRINVGQLTGGEGRNVIPSHAKMVLEVRGENAEINAYMAESAERILKASALAQNCEVTLEKMGEAVDLTNDPALVACLERAGAAIEGLTVRTDPMNFGGSEDATLLARRVQAHGGEAAFFVLGADRPSGHHTATFDVDEGALKQGLHFWISALQHLPKGG